MNKMRNASEENIRRFYYFKTISIPVSATPMISRLRSPIGIACL